MSLVLSCLDLTSLDEKETADRIVRLCDSARTPAQGLGSVAAVCVLPRFVGAAKERLDGSGVRVACATGAFPSGRRPIADRVREIAKALADGADEIDTVLDHQALLAGHERDVRSEMVASRDACGHATMKVIVESGAMPGSDWVMRATRIAIAARADFVKTSTGRVFPGASVEAVLAIAEAVLESGTPAGIKVSGGVRTTADALGHLDVVLRTLGEGWATPNRFRIGASSLLNELVRSLGP